MPATPSRHAKIWDLPTRLFHWLLVLSVVGALGTGLFAPAWMQPLHVGLGYAVAALVVFRLLWGFVGAPYSRFKSFLFSPAATLAHFRSLLLRQPSSHVGHNPAGAVMIFALLALLLGQIASGLAALGGVEKLGPLAGLISYAFGHQLAEVHEVLSTLLMVLIAGHLLGVAAESLLSGENLPRAMITGHKILRTEPAPRAPRTAVSLIGSGLLIALLAGAAFLGVRSNAAPTGDYLPKDVTGSRYAKECGDCHYAFPPSLLPAETWHQVMSNLSDHFGEDASLSADLAQEISDYLQQGAAEHWDTKAAHLFRKPNVQDPLRITSTRRWTRIHHDLSDADFKDPKVGGKTNCGSCHKDAAQGLFTLRMIQIPETKS
ncbi:cytochrome b/b6 domain-containing protein [Magnetospira thiophila]